MSGGSDATGPVILRATAADHAALRGVRLRALQDVPSAFGSTYDQESRMTAEEWQAKTRQWTDPHCNATWMAWHDQQTVGLVAGVQDTEDATRAWLVSMWVDPAFRRRGIARDLIQEVLGWSAGRGRSAVHLHVTSNNPVARELYLRMGFVTTGDSIPHPRRPDLVEYEMCCGVSVAPVE